MLRVLYAYGRSTSLYGTSQMRWRASTAFLLMRICDMGTEAHVLMETGYYSSPPYMNFGRIIYVTIILSAMRILGHVISVGYIYKNTIDTTDL